MQTKTKRYFCSNELYFFIFSKGGTMLAACKLVKKLGAELVECAFVVDLPDLGGKKKLEAEGYSTFTLVEFEGE